MKTTIEKLWNFEINANEETFISIFGMWLGTHLWAKFVYVHNRSILHLYGYLDTDNQQLLINHLETL